MTIEFHTQHIKTKDKILDFIREEVMNMARSDKEISRAEVTLREDETSLPSENKVCEIRITIFGNDIMAHRRTNSFNNAAKAAISELKKLVNEQLKKSQEPPDILTSTVKV